MNILAFDTCLGAVSVAYRHRAADGSWATVEAFEERQTGQAERLMPMLAGVLAEAGADFTRVQRVAVTLGPGTFTGVRTGIAAARAFRLAAGVDIVGVTSLAVIANGTAAGARGGGMASGRPVLVAVDARRGHVYVQLFNDGPRDPLRGPVEVTPEAALDMLDGLAASPLLVGSGARLVAEAAATRSMPFSMGPEHIEPHASDLAEMAAGLQALTDVMPIYIRPPDAKPQTGKSLARAP
ncbi:MAG: tRNA (adenosine(37)-N6)-threonylcarbamoyltransferase complex dimerization subunit type 1 TsaB [Hyphomicrobiaceae bacterium]|nr:tRNA (adenosine(37)-N6)-threonylcarbamoyltransferase complex dimerization subunit type 1 TsaB [Hyphomicrobiaceae bacterium]